MKLNFQKKYSFLENVDGVGGGERNGGRKQFLFCATPTFLKGF